MKHASTNDIAQGSNNYKLQIEGEIYFWDKDIITGVELRQLGNVPTDSTLYYKIQGKDAEVHDTETIDLGRIGTEKFYSIPNDPVYRFTINGEEFSHAARYITGKQLRALGNISEDEELYLKEEYNDPLINKDERVDLAPLGKEGFYSKKKKKITIYINGSPFNVEKGIMTYDEIVTLAFPDYPQHPERNYSVKYTKGGDNNKPDGILSKGGKVKVKDGTQFKVTPAGQS